MSLMNTFLKSSRSRRSFYLKRSFFGFFLLLGLASCTKSPEPVLDSSQPVDMRESLDTLIADFSLSFQQRLKSMGEKEVFSGMNPKISGAKIRIRKIEESLAEKLAGSEGTASATDYRMQAFEELLEVARDLSKDELLKYPERREFDSLADEMEDRYLRLKKEFKPASTP